MLILFPSVLNACLLIALSFNWSRIYSAVDDSVRKSDAVVDICKRFSSVLDLGYTTLSECFNTPLTELEVPSHEGDIHLTRTDDLGYSELGPLREKTEALRNEIERLPHTLLGVRFSSNVQRLQSYSGILTAGISLSKEFDGLVREQLNRNSQMWNVVEQKYAILKNILFVFLSLEIVMAVSLVIAFRNIVVRRLHGLVENTLAIARSDGRWKDLRGNDPLARLNRTIHTITSDLRVRDEENRLLERVLIENILGPAQRAEMFINSLRDQERTDNESQKQLAGWVQSATVAMERIRFFGHKLLARKEPNPRSLSAGRFLFPLKAVIEDCHKELMPSLAQKDLELICDCDDLSIFASRQQIVQVFINLLVNAIKFSPPGSRIAVRASKMGSLAYVRVIDTGPGVAEDVRSRVFDEFFSKDTHSDEGVGLGLAICRAIVQSQGGELGVISESNSGSEFWFSLPTSGEDVDGFERSTGVAPPASIRWSLYWRGVLLIAIPLLSQLATIVWLNVSLAEAHKLLVSERELATLALSENLLWLESFRGSSLTALQLVSRSESQRAEALRSLAVVRKRLKIMNSLSGISPDVELLIEQIEDSVNYQERMLEAALHQRPLDMNRTLGLLPQVIGRFENVNHDLGVLASHQLQELSAISEVKIASQRDAQVWIVVLLLVNLAVALLLLRQYDYVFSRRIAVLEEQAKSLLRLEKIRGCEKPRDEIDFLQNQFAEVSSELNNATNERERLLNTVAHDIRSPLQTLLLLLSMISDSDQKSGLRFDRAVLQSVNHDLKASVKVVNHLLSVNKLRSAETSNNSKAASLTDLVADAVANVAENAADSGVSINFETLHRTKEIQVDVILAGQLIEHALSCAIRLSQYDSEIRLVSTSEGNSWKVVLRFDVNPLSDFDLQNALLNSTGMASIASSEDIVLSLNCLVCVLLCRDLKAAISATEGTITFSIVND